MTDDGGMRGFATAIGGAAIKSGSFRCVAVAALADVVRRSGIAASGTGSCIAVEF
jgi:hypothetical protein